MKKHALIIVVLVAIIIGCKKSSETNSPMLSLEDTVSQRTLLFLDSIGVPNPSLQDMIGYDGNPLGRNMNIQGLAGNLIDAMLREAQSLSEQKTTTRYQSEGIDKPEHMGLVYSYGRRDVTQRLYPAAGNSIHTKYAVYGADCSGLMVNLIRKAGINIPPTNVENFESTLNSALTNDPIYNSLKLKNLANIPTTQMKSGDFILWINPSICLPPPNPCERHIGIISTVISPDAMIFQSNGDPNPKNEADQRKNLEQYRGVHPLSVIKATTGSGYWGTDYKILRLEDPTQTIADIDGNIYHTVIIGTQRWMVENLKTTRYRNGDPISNVADAFQWSNLTTAALSNYDNDVNNVNIYGRLYNWYAVNDSKNIAPIGWHVPSDAEWTILENYLGGTNIAGGKLKETGLTHWLAPNVAATNSSGFTGLPGGFRSNGGIFSSVGGGGVWWNTTESDASFARCRILNYSDNILRWDSFDKRRGHSVRCIKD